jgi:hypothetical protein
MRVNKGRKFHISDEEKERIREVKKTNKEIKELKASLSQNPNIELWAEISKKETYLKTVKRERMKRYERVKTKRNSDTLDK